MTKGKKIFTYQWFKNATFFIIILFSLFLLMGCETLNIENTDKVAIEENTSIEENSTVNVENQDDNPFAGNRLILVDGGDLSGHRDPNVVVDIGFGDREYLAYTNEHGQLVRVTAKEIILQNDATEPVLSSGRYYPDEAKVPGTESSTLDEGHVIADSLGGVSNAYNITPQESTLNRHGDQAYMEKVIRDAGGCTDFTAIITYSDTTTQIPSHYSYTYTLMGNIINDEFDNVNPDDINKDLGLTAPAPEIDSSSGVAISQLDKKAEYIIIENRTTDPVNLAGWKIISLRGNQSFVFTEFILQPNATVKVGDSGKNPDVLFHWLDGSGTWNNSQSDPAELYDSNGNLVDRYND